jgi:uncharacterized membrane protein YfcA
MLTPFRVVPYRAVGFAGLVVLSSLLLDAADWQPDRSLFAMVAVLREIPSWVGLSLVIFIAASVSSTVGFAFSAIAAAMIFHFVPDHVAAVQTMMVASIALQAYSVASLYRTISWRACAPFLTGGIVTIPVGIYLLLHIRADVYVIGIGLGVALYGLYMFFRSAPQVTRGGMVADVAVGALGGLTGPLAAFPGAFLSIWCGMRGWDKVTQRCIYQPYILILQVLTLAALSFASERAAFNAEVIVYAAPAVAGAWLGLRVFQKLTDVQFHRFVNLALIVSGVALVLK